MADDNLIPKVWSKELLQRFTQGVNLKNPRAPLVLLWKMCVAHGTRGATTVYLSCTREVAKATSQGTRTKGWIRQCSVYDMPPTDYTLFHLPRDALLLHAHIIDLQDCNPDG